MQKRTMEAGEASDDEGAGRRDERNSVKSQPLHNFGLRTAGERVWCLARDGALADRPEVRREGLDTR